MRRNITQQRKTSLRHGVSGAGPALGRDLAWPGASGTLACLLLAAAILLAPSVRATTYKWVDDQGVIHYSDKMPPEALNKGSIELNKQGIPVKKNDPALSPEQRRAREAEEERTRQAARVRDAIQRKDRALLQSYTNESEIDLTKNRALGTIDGQIQSAQAYTATLNKRKQDISARVAALGDKQLPPTLERELTNVNDELAKQAELIAAKRREITVATARYDADKKRWRELRMIAETEAGGTTTTAGGAIPPVGTIPTDNKKK